MMLNFFVSDSRLEILIDTTRADVPLAQGCGFIAARFRMRVC